jgi:hypothetical protein
LALKIEKKLSEPTKQQKADEDEKESRDNIAKEIGGLIITGVSNAEKQKVPKIPAEEKNVTKEAEPVKSLAEEMTDEDMKSQEREHESEKSQDFLDMLHNFHSYIQLNN